MPRKRTSVAPQSEVEVLLEQIDSLKKRLGRLERPSMSSIQTVNTANFHGPVQGLIAIDHVDGKVKYYHNNAWRVLGAEGSNIASIFLTNPLDHNAYFMVDDSSGWIRGRWVYVGGVVGAIYGYVRVPAGMTSASILLNMNRFNGSGPDNMQVHYAVGSTPQNPTINLGTQTHTNPPGTTYDLRFGSITVVAGQMLTVKITHSSGNGDLSLWGAWLERIEV